MTLEKTFDQLVEDSLNLMYGRPQERPYFTLTTDNPLSAGATTIGVTAGSEANFSQSDLVEIDYELIQVNGTSTNQLTSANRGFAGSTAVSHDQGSRVVKNPTWSKYQQGEAVKHAAQAIGDHIPNLVSEVYNRATGLQQIGLPGNTMNVVQVRYEITTTGKFVDLTGWDFIDRLPTSVVSSGKALRLSALIGDTDDVIVTRQIPWRWYDESADDGTYTSSPDPEDTLQLPDTAGDLIPVYASAWRTLQREITRSDLERLAEVEEETGRVQGHNIRLTRELWGQFYRRVDEVRSTMNVPKRRPYTANRYH